MRVRPLVDARAAVQSRTHMSAEQVSVGVRGMPCVCVCVSGCVCVHMRASVLNSLNSVGENGGVGGVNHNRVCAYGKGVCLCQCVGRFSCWDKQLRQGAYSFLSKSH